MCYLDFVADKASSLYWKNVAIALVVTLILGVVLAVICVLGEKPGKTVIHSFDDHFPLPPHVTLFLGSGPEGGDVL